MKPSIFQDSTCLESSREHSKLFGANFMTANIPSPKQILTRCVEEFEARTQIELVVSIKEGKESYFSFFWFYTLLATQVFWAVTLLWNDFFDYELLVLESLALIGICYLLLVKLELLKYLIPRYIKVTKLKNAAEKEFFKLGMYNTKRRSGLLVIYSHWENDCVLLADKGVEEKVTKQELDDFAKDFQVAFKAKDLTEAVGSQIRSFGVFWKTRWPNEDEENEIVHAFKDDLI